jgi:hypothetical protein
MMWVNCVQLVQPHPALRAVNQPHHASAAAAAAAASHQGLTIVNFIGLN